MQEHHEGPAEGHHYRRLALMSALSFAAMYALMYAMVDSWSNIYGNLNQAYMAGLMTAPMVGFELLLMRGMYRDRRRNAAILAASLVGGLLCLAAIRNQSAIGNRQFLRSMIPHHGAAILMCNEATFADPAIQDLCRRILANQTAEITEMKGLLRRTP